MAWQPSSATMHPRTHVGNDRGKTRLGSHRCRHGTGGLCCGCLRNDGLAACLVFHAGCLRA